MTGRSRTRANGEGSIFPYRSGYAAYSWVTRPDGTRTRKYVYGQTREAVHDKWIKLQGQAKAGPVVTTTPTLRGYLASWLRDVVDPNLAPATRTNYGMFVRLYIAPVLGDRRLDKLSVRDIQTWLNGLRQQCQCCVQGKDAARPAGRRRCCAVGRCCGQAVSDRTARDAWTVLRNALNTAIREELLTRNPAALVRVSKPRARKPKPWSVDEARRFLESARAAGDPLYAAYVLILVLGLRRGEMLGLRWEDVDLAAGELTVSYQPPDQDRGIRRGAAAAGNLRDRAGHPAPGTGGAPPGGRRRVAGLRTGVHHAPGHTGRATQLPPRLQGQGAPGRRPGDLGPRDPPDVRVAVGRAGRAPSGGHADLEAQPDLGDHECLQRGSVQRDPQGAQQAR